MTRLLVSVRNAAEARIAREEEVDLIDVKEPARGSLGAADAATIAAVIGEVNGQRPVSAALGELLEEVSLPHAVAAQLTYAKFGLAGCAARHEWPGLWRQAADRLPATRLVAVAYADWQGRACAGSVDRVGARSTTWHACAYSSIPLTKSAGPS